MQKKGRAPVRKSRSEEQLLFPQEREFLDLKSDYFISHLITYIGNKRSLLPFINEAICKIRNRLKKEKIRALDGFSGSGAVSRLLKYHSSELISNDLEDYCETINRAYLANRSDIDLNRLFSAIDYLNTKKLEPTKSLYFISNNYAPVDGNNILPGERVFYTPKNAKIIDNIRYLIDNEVDEDLKVYCLANLLIKASIHTNTSGVFKGFHKDGNKGSFGGRGKNALHRIMSEINLDYPIFSDVESKVTVTKEDVNSLVERIGGVDLAYFDPPYNQHPYGSNYFMLNVINKGGEDEIQDGVSGIKLDWNRSAYNKRVQAEESMDHLLANTNAKIILISYNDEGIIPLESFKRILDKYGKWELIAKEYNTYRGSRNLCNRNNKVNELLWILEKF